MRGTIKQETRSDSLTSTTPIREGSLSSLGGNRRLGHFVERRLGFLEIGGIESFDKPAVDRRETAIGLRAFALVESGLPWPNLSLGTIFIRGGLRTGPWPVYITAAEWGDPRNVCTSCVIVPRKVGVGREGCEQGIGPLQV